MFPSYHTENSKTKRTNIVDLDEVAHIEPPHKDLHCLEILLVLAPLYESTESAIVDTLTSAWAWVTL